MEDPTLLETWRQIGSDIQILAMSGAAGAFVRALVSPEGQIKRRIIQGVGGVASAIFLGGALSNIIGSMFAVDSLNAVLASGFLMGVSGEVAIKAMQDKIFGKKS